MATATYRTSLVTNPCWKAAASPLVATPSHDDGWFSADLFALYLFIYAMLLID
jgi:hypothetical protein